jgi:PAS domain-containing protein
MDPQSLQSLAFEAAAAALAVVRPSADRRQLTILAANREFARVVGRGLVHPSGASGALFAVDDPADPEAALAREIAAGRRAAVFGVLQRPDGTEIRVEARVSSLPDADGAAVLALRPIADATGRPSEADLALAALDAATEELAVTDAALRAVADAFPGAVVVLDADGSVRLVAGLALDDIGVPPIGLDDAPEAGLPPAVEAALAPFVGRAFTGQKTRFDFTLAGRTFEGVAAPARLETGRLGGAVIALVDVTDTRDAYRALEPTTGWAAVLARGAARRG